MIILDVFSKLPEKQISLEQLQEIFIKLVSGESVSDYSVCFEIPDSATENDISCRKELLSEGRKVAFIIKETTVIATIGYKE